MRQAVSGGGEHGGRVLESVHKRLEQQNDEKMNQDVRSGGTFVKTWWPFDSRRERHAKILSLLFSIC
jgi:hypothetical protein